MEKALLLILPLILGYLLDLLLGDPDGWPHPVRVFGQVIAWADRRWNQGSFRVLKGAVLALGLVFVTYLFFFVLARALRESPWLYISFNALMVYFGLANRGLIDEGRKVFTVLEKRGLVDGRRQLSRIVGRDTRNLSPQQIRIAVLETMSENLSDGVVAPLFFYLLGGVPAMMAYKAINTLDSMIGYRNEKYEYFGKVAARVDDIANFIPARLTAIGMVIVTAEFRAWRFVRLYARHHTSPNAGYPEAALAGILDCRFGGPNVYHGQLKDKPYIGRQERAIQAGEVARVITINHRVCGLMVLVCSLILLCTV
ncbi:adenosylcobinamide-phosphate synthase [Dyadobacter jejuensis]|uniref:Cobalamin biosynthesis protein CobD n=1 Tax=Dyadobacter jejuensis TaxID=1082580 RepID=A0A316ADS5_9BACT|nr:adenosylcobinamide-phosphate synthase CbiB [Dyadobacter jejuensis]PWJ55034.1 adenosylcobinamide-phosphate synthase [Dyadobacter jejuensis]